MLVYQYFVPSLLSMNINGINPPTKTYDKLRQGFLGNVRASFLKPEKFISHGGFGAVWSAKYSPNDTSEGIVIISLNMVPVICDFPLFLFVHFNWNPKTLSLFVLTAFFWVNYFSFDIWTLGVWQESSCAFRFFHLTPNCRHLLSGGVMFFPGSSKKEHDVAVKVLYNYYDSIPSDGEEMSFSTLCSNHHGGQRTLLDTQIDREVNLRPPGKHANIVPLSGTFFDRAPPSKFDLAKCDDGKESAQGSWENVEHYPHGFGGRPHTWYLLMPL